MVIAGLGKTKGQALGLYPVEQRSYRDKGKEFLRKS